MAGRSTCEISASSRFEWSPSSDCMSASPVGIFSFRRRLQPLHWLHVRYHARPQRRGGR
jgi:hypothetical protein